jgi:SPX domain protein involved in polyphosphate accumulation
MGEYRETFKRTEQKYLLDEQTYRKIIKELSGYAKVDQYGKTTICNIYYDTPDHKLVRRSLEKPLYKEKVRVRSYGTPSKGSTVFVELKKKYDGVVYKRRVDMSLEQSDAFSSERILPMKNPQIEKELTYCFSLYEGLAPAMYLSYDRIALYANDDPEVRITFDSNVIYREKALDLSRGVWGSELLNKGERIMEIKIAGAMPMWLVRILDKLDIYPTSFSKYGAAYQKEMTNKNMEKESVYCA